MQPESRKLLWDALQAADLITRFLSGHSFETILAHLGLPAEVPQPDPPQPPPAYAPGHTGDVIA
jgi:hypothetical protein